MTGEAPPAAQTRQERPLVRRGFKYALVATYLGWLVFVPEWAFLGFRSGPVAEEATLEQSEAERYPPISWETLGGFPYEFEVPGTLDNMTPAALTERHERLIPSHVRALDRRTVALRGYVIPMVIERGRVTEFILAAKNELGCCFGDGLAMNQWVRVAVPEGEKVEFGKPKLATVLGVLEVGEEVLEGTVMSLYRMHDATVRSW
ncbi:MAG: hypothetical protein AAF430_21430 [Myxococcota bacterium]